MKKKFYYLAILFLATNFCFAQNEVPYPGDESFEVKPDSDTDSYEEKEKKSRDFQLTFITPLGTNGSKSTEYINGISFNIFGGVNGGLDGVELGGFANVLTGSGEGFQAAGFTNVVRGNFDGFQAAGFVNANMRRTEGFQAAGFVNFVKEDFDGFQAAGFVNANLKKTDGVQIAGYVNSSLGGFDGAQIAGFINVTGGYSDGAQISGFLNVAKNHEGLQFGLINIADSIDGVSIGLLSLARNGYFTLEASSNETLHANLAFKTGGNRHFYNIFSTGIRFGTEDDLNWAFGYGIGSHFMFRRNWGINVDAITHIVLPRLIDSDRDWEDEDFSSVSKLNLNLSYRLGKYATVFGGPSLNVLVNENQSFIDDLNPIKFFSGTNDGFNVIIYPGFNVGIRI